MSFKGFPDPVGWAWSACIALMMLAFASPSLAEMGKLRERLTPEVMSVVFPAGAERLGDEEGSPPAIAVYRGDKPVAYIFSTLDIIAPRGLFFEFMSGNVMTFFSFTSYK